MGGFNFFLCSELEKLLPKKSIIFFFHLLLQFYVLLFKDLLTKVHVAKVSDKTGEGVSPFPSIKVGVSNSSRTLHGGDVGGRLYFIYLFF